MSKPARNYHAAMSVLTRAEQRYQEALDALNAALAERRAHDVPGLRLAVGRAEHDVKLALEAATIAHRGYWHARRVELEPMLREAGVLMHRYDRIARAEGPRTVHPALSQIRAFYADAGPQPDIVDDAGVPIEPPDSELLGDAMGAWRY